MDIGAARALIEKTDTDFSIKNRFVRGIGILLIHCESDEELHSSFEHDQMWIGNFETLVKRMTARTVKRLAKMGWFEDADSWSHH